MKFLIPIAILLIGSATTLWLFIQCGRRSKQIRDQGEESGLIDRVITSHQLRDDGLSNSQRATIADDLLRQDRKRVLWMGLPFTMLTTALAAIAVVDLSPNSNPEIASTFFVVANNGELEKLAVTPEGITLRQAAVQARFSDRQKRAPDQADEEEVGTWFVLLDRSNKDGSDMFYVPLNFVLDGPGGDVRIDADDYLRLVNLVDTDLGVLTSTQPGLEFSVAGLISKPGQFKTVEMSEEFMNVASPDYAGTYDVGPEGPDVIVVSRSRTGDGQDHYVIPLRGPFGDISLFQSRLKANDKLNFCQINEFQLWQ